MDNDTYNTLQIEKITLEIAQIRNEIAMQPTQNEHVQQSLDNLKQENELNLTKMKEINQRIDQLTAQTWRDKIWYPVFGLIGSIVATATITVAIMRYLESLALTP